MSCETMTWAMEVQTEPLCKLLLLLMADMGDMDGVYSGPMDDLRARACMTQEQFRSAMVGLQQADLVYRAKDNMGALGWQLNCPEVEVMRHG